MASASDRITEFLESKHRVKSQINESDHHPVSIGYNICYIVAAIIIKDKHVLMMRESKKRCYGKWYLPAGRMEKNETMEEAVKREVKEETHMDVNVHSLICVESQICWLRFTFSGVCVGGKLKQPSQEDKDSIEAKWIPIDDVMHYEKSSLDLRAPDIVPLVAHGASWYMTNQPIRESYVLPVMRSHSVCLLRIFLVCQENDNLFIFTGKSGMTFIESVISLERKDLSQLIRAMLEANGFVNGTTMHGVLSLEHTGNSNNNMDGFLITTLAETKHQSVAKDPQWIILDDVLLSANIKHLISDRLCPLILSCPF